MDIRRKRGRGGECTRWQNRQKSTAVGEMVTVNDM